MSAISFEMSVFIFGSNSISREGLRLLLEEDGFTVLICQETYSDREGGGMDLASPRLIVLDMGAEDCSDVDLRLLQAGHPQAFVVVLADNFDFDRVMDAFEAGVDGYIIKEIGCRPLMESLRLVAMGEKVMPSALAQFLPGRTAQRSHQAVRQFSLARTLSGREIETFRRMCCGEPNKVIARNLGISEATVKVHVKAILRKLHLQNRTQAVAWALNSGLDLAATEPLTGPAENEALGLLRHAVPSPEQLTRPQLTIVPRTGGGRSIPS